MTDAKKLECIRWLVKRHNNRPVEAKRVKYFLAMANRNRLAQRGYRITDPVNDSELRLIKNPWKCAEGQ